MIIQKLIVGKILQPSFLHRQSLWLESRASEVRGPGTFYHQSYGLILVYSVKLPPCSSAKGAAFPGILFPWGWYKSKGSRVLGPWTNLKYCRIQDLGEATGTSVEDSTIS